VLELRRFELDLIQDSLAGEVSRSEPRDGQRLIDRVIGTADMALLFLGNRVAVAATSHMRWRAFAYHGKRTKVVRV